MGSPVVPRDQILPRNIKLVLSAQRLLSSLWNLENVFLKLKESGPLSQLLGFGGGLQACG